MRHFNGSVRTKINSVWKAKNQPETDAEDEEEEEVQEPVETEAGAPCASDPEHDYDAATDGSSLSGQEEHMSHTQEMEGEEGAC